MTKIVRRSISAGHFHHAKIFRHSRRRGEHKDLGQHFSWSARFTKRRPFCLVPSTIVTHTSICRRAIRSDQLLCHMEEVRLAVVREKLALVATGAEGSSCYRYSGGMLTMGRVLRKKTFCKGTITIIFELYNEQTEEFLLSCVAREGSSDIVFTTLRDLDRRDANQLVVSPYSSTFLGVLQGRGIGRLTWALYGDDTRTCLCTVRFYPSLVASPVQFQLQLHGASPEASGGRRQVRRERVGDSFDVRVKTKMPSWNTELQTFVHNFGCRVKLPSHRNFIALRVTTGACAQELVGTAAEAASGGRSDAGAHAFRARATIDHDAPICLRHGQVSTNEYVLDFGDPLSPLVAMATFCAVHAPKSLVATGP